MQRDKMKMRFDQQEEYIARYVDEELYKLNLLRESEYINSDTPIKVKCVICGYEFDRTFHNILSKHKMNEQLVICKNCRDTTNSILKEENKRNKDINRLVNIYTRNKEQERNALFKWLKKNTIYMNVCANCGEEFNTQQRRKYCSKRCLNRYNERQYKTKRDERIQNQYYDKDITLDILYKIDKGICHICNGECDYEDYIHIGSTMVAGNEYPSIDHLIPLAKGGTHTWNNIRLAHRLCNSIKGCML